MIFKLTDDVQKLERQVADLESKSDSKELENYYQFFNAETESIADLIASNDIQALIDRNNKYKEILFETRVKSKAVIRGMQTVLQNMDEVTRKQYEEFEISATATNLSDKSPVSKADKKVKQKKDAIAALEALGLDGDALLRAANKFGIGKKADELKVKRNESVAAVTEADKVEKKAESEAKSAEVKANISAAKSSFLSAFKK